MPDGSSSAAPLITPGPEVGKCRQQGFLIGLVAGGAIGAALAIVFAPRTHDLRRRGRSDGRSRRRGGSRIPPGDGGHRCGRTI